MQPEMELAFERTSTDMAEESMLDFSAGPMTQELYLFFFFCLGFVIFRTEYMQRLVRGSNQDDGKRKHICSRKAHALTVAVPISDEIAHVYSIDQLHDDFESGEYDNVVAGWRDLEFQSRSIEALTMVVTSLVALGRPDEVGMFVAKSVATKLDLRPQLRQVIEAIVTPKLVLNAQHINTALRDIYDQASCDLRPDALKVLFVAFAERNDEDRSSKAMQRLEELGAPADFDTLVSAAQGFLACKNLAATLGHLKTALMVRGRSPLRAATPAGETATVVPPGFLVAATRCATEAAIACADNAARPRTWDMLELLEKVDGGTPQEALILLLEWATRQSPMDVSMALRVERRLRALAGGELLPLAACDALVRVHASCCGSEVADACSGNDRGAAACCFDEYTRALAVAENPGPLEGSLVVLLSACLEPRNADLAEHIFDWSHRKGCCSAPILSATIKVLVAARRPERICGLWEVMDSTRLEIDDAVFGQFIKAAVQAGKLDLARKIYRRAKNPDAQNCMSLIRACGQEGDAPQALAMLRELRDRGEADTSAYNCALDVCFSCGDTGAAQGLFQEMRASRRVDAISYNILLKQLVRADSGASASDLDALLEEMRKAGLRPNLATYNSVICAAMAVGDFARAWRTVDIIESQAGAHAVDVYTVTSLFKGYRRERDRPCMDKRAFDRAISLISKYSVKVDEVLVNVALEACVSLRDQARLGATLEAFAKAGFAVPQQCGMLTYGILIKANGQNRQMNVAWKYWREATTDRGLVASEQLYGQMIDALVSNDCMGDALRLFRDMQEVHKERWDSPGFSVAYAMIIRGYAQRKECGRALECYEEMQAHGAKVGLVVFNTLVDACSRVGDMDSAARLFTDIVDADCTPDLITYSTLIKGYCVRAELDKAMELLALMRRKGIVPDAIVFNSLLDGCAKQQMPGLCEQVIHDMVEAGISPSNHSASILIKLHSRCRDVDAAFRVIDEMPQMYGFRPNAAVYTCLMATCVANGRLSDALALRERMLQDRALPDEKTYSTLLRGTLRAGSADQCLTLVRAAMEQGNACALLDEELVQSVVKLVQRRKGDAQVHDLVEDLRHAGVTVHFPQSQRQNQQQRQERLPRHDRHERQERMDRPPTHDQLQRPPQHQQQQQKQQKQQKQQQQQRQCQQQDQEQQQRRPRNQQQQKRP